MASPASTSSGDHPTSATRFATRPTGQADADHQDGCEPLIAAEAADRLDLPIKELLRLVYERKIRYVMVNGIAHIPEDAVDEQCGVEPLARRTPHGPAVVTGLLRDRYAPDAAGLLSVDDHRAVRAPAASLSVTDGEPPLVVAIRGRFDACAEAALEDVMTQVRRMPRDVVFDVAGVDELDVQGILVLADHARGLRRRSCSVVLRGASRSSRQLVGLLGYDQALGLA